MKQEEMMLLLDFLYTKAVDGIQTKLEIAGHKVDASIEKMANDYLAKDDVIQASKKFINNQLVKCTTSGFITGLGGIITLPVAVTANIGSVLYVQLRMIAGLAYMGGYDVRSDQVQTLVYACLAGVSVDQILKNAGIKVTTKLTENLIKKIPGEVIKTINSKVGFRLITKSGKTGVVNLTKTVPVVGGIVGGGFDFVETKIIANRAYKLFIEGDLTAADDEEIIEVYC